MDKLNRNKIKLKKLWVAPILIISATLTSCSEFSQIREHDENPLCKEMRRTCKEYSEYQKITDGKKSQRLNELEETCYEYSKSCGEAINRVGEQN
jgi:hypothetical protein